MQENADGTYKIPDSIKVDLGTGKLLFCGRSITLTQADHCSKFCMPNCQSSLYRIRYIRRSLS